MILAVIAACEVAFWIVLGVGLVTRYLLRLRRTSAVILLCVPLVDVVLLVATAIDLHGGAVADFTHGLAAAYLGFSIAFGRDMIRWADERFAHRFAGGPPPWQPPKYGAGRVRYEWISWAKGVLGWAVACGLLALGIWYVDDGARTEQLLAWIGQLSLVIVGWLLFFPVWATLSPPKRKDRPAPQ